MSVTDFNKRIASPPFVQVPSSHSEEGESHCQQEGDEHICGDSVTFVGQGVYDL
jgi:hypothetical protein